VNRQMNKRGFVDRAGRGAVAGSPSTAWQNLMQLVQPTAKPNVPTAQGLNLQPMTPGGGMGGQNTPSTNPIGLMSGLGPLRQALHASRQMIKRGFTGRATATGSPTAAWQNLMQLVQPTAKPNVPTAQGLNLQPMTPGDRMGGQNTPSTNPIGLMSGLRRRPGTSAGVSPPAIQSSRCRMPTTWPV
jgi:hypothetical protein